MWSVRERLSARAGRLHQRREARRVGKEMEAPASSMPEESEAEYVLPKHKHKKRRRRSRDRDRRRRRRSGSRGRSSLTRSRSSRGSSSRSAFRGASNVAATSSRAARDSVHKPHLVLVDTLTQMCHAQVHGGGGNYPGERVQETAECVPRVVFLDTTSSDAEAEGPAAQRARSPNVGRGDCSLRLQCDRG